MIRISPAVPHTNSSIEIEYFGGGCVNQTSQVIVGQDFQYYIDFDADCFSPPPGFSFTWQVGPLVEGSYFTGIYVSTDGGAATRQVSQDFSVIDYDTLDFQAVPLMPAFAFVVLGILVAGMVFRKLHP